ncbi:MAG: hypothetical protein IPM35_15190 [Myxococcales bacterium]|nr:hypothetical protein [Myxococcales bacterium]
MYKTAISTLLALTLMATGKVAVAEQPPKPPASVDELDRHAKQLARTNPKRHRELSAEVARLRAKQRASNAWYYGGMSVGAGILAGGMAWADKKECDAMPEATAEQLEAKADCHGEAAKILTYALGFGVGAIAVGYVASKVVEPSREDVRRAYRGTRRETSRVRFSIAGDPRSKSASASMRFVF